MRLPLLIIVIYFLFMFSMNRSCLTVNNMSLNMNNLIKWVFYVSNILFTAYIVFSFIYNGFFATLLMLIEAIFVGWFGNKVTLMFISENSISRIGLFLCPILIISMFYVNIFLS